MSDERAKILEKVNKLLALAEGRASIEESAAAAAKAQELIERYRIDQAELEHAGAPREGVGTLPLYRVTKGRARSRALLILADRISKLYDCFSYVCRHEGADWVVLVGQKTDCDLALCMLWFLEKAIDVAARKVPLRGFELDVSFRLGMVDRLVERLEEIRKDARSGASHHALVMLRNRADDALREAKQHIDLEDVHVDGTIDPRAHFLGRLAGDRVELMPSLGGARA